MNQFRDERGIFWKRIELELFLIPSPSSNLSSSSENISYHEDNLVRTLPVQSHHYT